MTKWSCVSYDVHLPLFPVDWFSAAYQVSRHGWSTIASNTWWWTIASPDVRRGHSHVAMYSHLLCVRGMIQHSNDRSMHKDITWNHNSCFVQHTSAGGMVELEAKELALWDATIPATAASDNRRGDDINRNNQCPVKYNECKITNSWLQRNMMNDIYRERWIGRIDYNSIIDTDLRRPEMYEIITAH